MKQKSLSLASHKGRRKSWVTCHSVTQMGQVSVFLGGSSLSLREWIRQNKCPDLVLSSLPSQLTVDWMGQRKSKLLLTTPTPMALQTV